MVLSLGLSYVYAWTAPTANPPLGNVSAPINTSATAQTKVGALTVSAMITGKSFVDADNLDLTNPAYFIKPTGMSTFWDVTVVGTTTTTGLRVPGGTAGQALISDANGNATWGEVTSTLWAWGNNAQAQLGDGTIDSSLIPIRVSTGVNWQSVSAGNKHSLAIKTDGTTWAAGSTEGGNFTKTTSWQSVSAGEEYSLATKIDGTLWAMGKNNSGELGDGTTQTKRIPGKIGTDNNWQAISAGSSNGGFSGHSLAIKTDGTLWAWGSDASGQIGNGSIITGNQLNPTQIQIPGGPWQSVSAGDEHSLAIKMDGTLWAWGSNADGQLGDGTTSNKTSPFSVAGTWKFVSAGGRHSVGIKTDGTLWRWGQTSGPTVLTPTKIGTDTTWRSISAGERYFIAIKTDGSMWAMGKNNNGELGDRTNTNRDYLVQVGAGINWQSVSAGDSHTIAIGI